LFTEPGSVSAVDVVDLFTEPGSVSAVDVVDVVNLFTEPAPAVTVAEPVVVAAAPPVVSFQAPEPAESPVGEPPADASPAVESPVVEPTRVDGVGWVTVEPDGSEAQDASEVSDGGEDVDAREDVEPGKDLGASDEPLQPEPPVSEVAETEPLTPEPLTPEPLAPELLAPELLAPEPLAPEPLMLEHSVAVRSDAVETAADRAPTGMPSGPVPVLAAPTTDQPGPMAGSAESGPVPETPERSIAMVVQRTHEVVRFLPTFTDPVDQAQAEELNIEFQRLAARVDERYDLIEATGITTADVDDDDLLMRLPTVYGLDMAGTAEDGSAAEWELALTRLLVRDTRLSVASRTDETVTVLTGRQLADALTRLRVAGPAGLDVAPGGPAGRAWHQMLRRPASRPALAMLALPSGQDLAVMVDGGEGSLVQAYVGGVPVPSKGRLPRYACYPPASVPGSTRHLDAEKKLFDYLATNHHEDLAQGQPSVTVTSTEPMCPSCCYVVLQFLADFPQVSVVTVRPVGVRPARGLRRFWSSRS
jgi:hypothetical protein